MNSLLKSVLGITIVIIILDYHLLNRMLQTELGSIVKSNFLKEDPPIWKMSNIFWEFRDSPHNMPLIYHENQKPKSESKCGALPVLDHIEFHNSYWQHFRSSQAAFYIFSAFIDDRLHVPQVKIMASVFRLSQVQPKVNCQLWYNSSVEPLVTEGSFQKMWDISNIISCNISQSLSDNVPVSVSLVENPCDKSTNNIRIFYEKPIEKEDIGVCFVAVNFPKTDKLAIQLVESIHLMRLTGVSKSFFYPRNIDPKTEKVLLYFADKGYISIFPFQNPGHLENLRMAKHDSNRYTIANEVLALNDCLYRNMYRYKYLAMLDVDEIIIPKMHDKLIDMVEETVKLYRAMKNHTLNMISTTNFYFTDGMLIDKGGVSPLFPDYLHMTQHVYRSKENTKPIKFLYNASSTSMAYHHQPLSCIHDKVNTPECPGEFELPLELGAKHHYRFVCAYLNMELCHKNNTVKDTTIRKYWPALQKEVETTMAEIGWDILPARAFVNQTL